ncbi:VLP2p-1, transcript variant X2 [Venturia canescens]|uniref:VLP2p-1, transcript variant X2 n=1 Tax=Venturia canescens TaxID=32260 RepID=A0ACB9ZHQ5_9HYME|nr:rac GTPase-activating protein 1-like [Venturia canescens]KAI5630582.1 VLP2p-1, transcript variant X2 [Venturia canescens]
MDRAAFKEELSRRLAKRSQGFPEGNAQPTPTSSSGLFRSPNPQRKNTSETNSCNHEFKEYRAFLKSANCSVCSKKINAREQAWRCSKCQTIVHEYCEKPIEEGNYREWGTISDYAPVEPPMIPSLIVAYVNAVEADGLTVRGLYKVPGPTRRSEFLVEQFRRNEEAPSLIGFNVHEITYALKRILRSLSEPLVTDALRDNFIDAVTRYNAAERAEELALIVLKLPQANRDTLAFLMIHLQLVSGSKNCKMNKKNLARIFGPVLVFDSTQNSRSQSDREKALEEIEVVESLLNIPAEIWAPYADFERLSRRIMSAVSRSHDEYSGLMTLPVNRAVQDEDDQDDQVESLYENPTSLSQRMIQDQDAPLYATVIPRSQRMIQDQDDSVYENVNRRSQRMNQDQDAPLYATVIPRSQRTIQDQDDSVYQNVNQRSQHQRKPAHAARTPHANRRFQ